MYKFELTKEYLEAAYCKNNGNIKSISRELKRSWSTVKNKLKEYGIATNLPGSPKKFNISKEFLEKEYVFNNYSSSKISRDLGCSQALVSLRIREYGLDNTKKEKIYEFQNLAGKKFGKLLVVKRTKNRKSRSFWLCLCDCGNEVEILGNNLVYDQTHSCGCILKEINFKGFGDISLGYWNRLKSAAKCRSHKFELSIEDGWNLFLKQNRKCALSNIDLYFCKNVFKDGRLQTASLDRIDNSKGYIEGNVQWVHKDINLIRLDFDVNYFIELCKIIANNNCSGDKAGKLEEVNAQIDFRAD